MNNEEEAIRLLKQGDIRGLKALVQRYQTEAVRTAFLITRDRSRAEDVAQDAFLRVAARIEQFDTSRPFAPWFFRIVTNLALKASTRAPLQFSLEQAAGEGLQPLLELLPDERFGPEGHLSDQLFREAVWDALGKLSPKQRAVIILRYYLEMSEAEMAEELDVASGTVKSRLYAARARLRQLLEPAFSFK